MSWGFNPGTQAIPHPQIEDGPELEERKKDRIYELFKRNTKIAEIIAAILLLVYVVISFA